jgi:uncharacterized protein (UPF0248 family)
MKTPREVLNEIRWRYDRLKDVEILYIHRGAPDNTKILQGIEIKAIRGGFVETRTFMLPYHRILKIKLDNRIIYEKK